MPSEASLIGVTWSYSAPQPPTKAPSRPWTSRLEAPRWGDAPRSVTRDPWTDVDGDGRDDLVSKQYAVSWGAKTAIASGFGSVSDDAVYVL